MCGIAGFWNRNGSEPDQSIVANMLTSIAHRGPDDIGVFSRGSAAIGHVRLSLIDLSQKGKQPFITTDGLGVLSYNGELYNYVKLRHELSNEGITFRSGSDSEVFLYALHRWGVENALKKFDGMFAFSYFDARHNTLWLGRDRLGIKPMYYQLEDNTLIFASEIKAILKHPR